jgi:hypothetical protein
LIDRAGRERFPHTAKSCGSGAPTLALSWRRCSSIVPMTGARKPGPREEREGNRKTIAQGMFWHKNALNINVVLALCRRLCRDPRKLLIAVKKIPPRPLMRSRPCPVSDSGSRRTTHGRGALALDQSIPMMSSIGMTERMLLAKGVENFARSLASEVLHTIT